MTDRVRQRRSTATTQRVICPRCLRERDRMQTFITHGCVNEDECFRYVQAERDRLRVELQEAHTWLEGAGIDDCEHRGYEGTKLCRFAEALRDIPDRQKARLNV